MSSGAPITTSTSALLTPIKMSLCPLHAQTLYYGYIHKFLCGTEKGAGVKSLQVPVCVPGCYMCNM